MNNSAVGDDPRFNQLADRLADPAFLVHPDFHPTLEYLRREDPVHWVQAWPQRGLWAVTSYDAVKQVFLDARNFSSEQSGSMLPVDPALLDRIDREAYGLGKMIAFTDPPRHDEVRRASGSLFNARVAAAAAKCQEICDHLVEKVIGAGECEIVADLASPVPSHLICYVVGVPENDWDFAKTLVDRFLDGAGGKSEAGLLDAAAAQDAMQKSRDELIGYVTNLVKLRRAEPGDDLTTDIINIHVKGVPLGDDEVIWLVWALIMGGFETSRNVISGGLVALIENPDQMAVLQADPSLLNRAVDELVRWTTPGQVNLRTALHDVQLGGKTIRAGDWLTTWPISANRDEKMFKEPFRLDVTRYPNPHLAFGFGIHNCIGRPIALLEVRVMLKTILRRLKDFEFVGDLKWTGTTVAMGLEYGRLRFKAV